MNDKFPPSVQHKCAFVQLRLWNSQLNILLFLVGWCVPDLNIKVKLTKHLLLVKCYSNKNLLLSYKLIRSGVVGNMKDSHSFARGSIPRFGILFVPNEISIFSHYRIAIHLTV